MASPAYPSSAGTAAAARARVEAEGDVEEGGGRADAAAARVGAGPAPAAWVGAPEVAAVLSAEADGGAQGLVLPCAPSDEEKVGFGAILRGGEITRAVGVARS